MCRVNESSIYKIIEVFYFCFITFVSLQNALIFRNFL